jgi:hypothetical protein
VPAALDTMASTSATSNEGTPKHSPRSSRSNNDQTDDVQWQVGPAPALEEALLVPSGARSSPSTLSSDGKNEILLQTDDVRWQVGPVPAPYQLKPLAPGDLDIMASTSALPKEEPHEQSHPSILSSDVQMDVEHQTDRDGVHWQVGPAPACQEKLLVHVSSAGEAASVCTVTIDRKQEKPLPNYGGYRDTRSGNVIRLIPQLLMFIFHNENLLL